MVNLKSSSIKWIFISTTQYGRIDRTTTYKKEDHVNYESYPF